MRLLKKVLFILALILVVLLGICIGQQNSQEVTFTLIGFQLPGLELGIFSTILFLLSLSLGMLLTLPPFLKYRRAAKRYRRRLLDAETKAAKNSLVEK